MANEFRHKIIIDPVHGDIGLSKLETKLIDTPTFQRLKKIKQLGFAHTVYPSARHTRFEHSLGVMHIMSRIISNTYGKVGEIGEEDIQKLRIAALLHDIGHYPYSHVMEKIDWDSAQRYMKKKGQEETNGGSIPSKYPNHERLGGIIITERKDIKEMLEKGNINPEEIASLIKGEHQSLPNLLNKSFDVDRLDYLVRDSISTGLPYGKVDINYIVNNIERNEDNDIVVRAKARNSVEHMLIARYFMFNTLYMHKTVFAFEEIVRRIILMLWDKSKIYVSGEEIEEMARADSEEFLAFHDGYLDKLVDEYANKQEDKNLAALCNAVKFRKPPKLVYKFAYFVTNGNIPEEHAKKHGVSKSDWNRQVEEFAREFNIPKELWFFNNIKGPDFEKLHPFVGLAEAADLDLKEIEELVKIKEESGEIINLVTDKSSVLCHLSRLKLVLLRIYVVVIDGAETSRINERIEEWLRHER